MEDNRLLDGDRSDAKSLELFAHPPNSDRGVSEAQGFERDSRYTALYPQHFCIVTETYTPEINGVALTLAHLVEGLRARGHRVSIVHPKPRGNWMSKASPNSEIDIQLKGLPLPGYQGLQFGMPAGRALRRRWSSPPLAAVYVATEGPLGLSAVRTARRMGIPVVSGFHTNFHTYCDHYGVAWLRELAFRYLRWFHNQTERTLVANEQLRARLQDAGFRNLGILERGVDSQQFDPQRRCAELRREWGLSEQDLVLLYVGRIAAEKNLLVAIDAYRAIKQAGARTKFVVVGDGPLRRGLQSEHPDLIFAGMRTGDELARHYASADVFLFPSETETFGNVTLEAMASGLAVIAYDYACAKLHISQGETGVLVQFGNAKDFVGSASALIREPQAIRRIRRQARQYVTYLGWPRVVERFEGILLSAGARNRSESASPLTRRRLAT